MKIRDTYTLYIGGKPKGKDATAGSLLMEKLTSDELYITVEKVINVYREQGKKREQFHRFVNRIRIEVLSESHKIKRRQSLFVYEKYSI